MKDVIIADKQDITRVGLESLIRDTKKASAILYANSKAEILKLLPTHPDSVVILDYTLLDISGVDELLNISYRFPNIRWMLFSDELSSDLVKRLIISSESYSVVLKTCELVEISMGIFQLFAGERFLCSRITNQILQAQKTSPSSADNLLTSTEKEVLKEIALGHTTKEIAAHRNLSFHTVITHRKNIFRKLEVNNVHEAIKYAMRAGLIDSAEYYI